MKKLILLAATVAMALPSAAMAQHYDRNHHKRTEVRHDRRDVRHDRRDVRQDRRDLQRDRRDYRQDRRHVRTAYVAPVRNWRYRPVNVGYRLQSVYYQPRYYVSDYGMYRLQAPRYSYLRWIRYGDDLLLVNIRTGRVLNVVHYRYW